MAIYCVTVRNVNEALGQGISWLAGPMGVEEPSRNGPVRVSPYPVVTTYANPAERVLFSPMRDANPFFHLFEALWMLAGRNDLPWLVQFNNALPRTAMTAVRRSRAHTATGGASISAMTSSTS
jgi:hypothetical protein